MTPLSQYVAHILAQADKEIAAHRPLCQSSGRCCRFDSFGHRLYVTEAELLHFAEFHFTTSTDENRNSKTENRRSLPLTQLSGPLPDACPYQIDNLCTARAARPLGCRIFFCDPDNQTWQPELYEKYHEKLRAIHDQFHLPYRYVEWRTALRELAHAQPAH